MGACDFQEVSYGKDLNDAFNRAFERANYEHGHDAYNGTISTTSLKGIDHNAPRYGTKAFYKYIDARYDTDGIKKWECYAVEVKGKALKEYRKRHHLERRKIKVYYFFGLAGC